MEGAIGDDVGMGIVPRAIHDIHRMANAYNNDNCNVQLSVSMTEVYMERCVDLFAHVMSPRTGAAPVSTTSRPMRVSLSCLSALFAGMYY